MFKDKKFVRRLALMLCLSLVVGLVPVGIASAPVKVNAVPETSANLLANGSFESGKDGWNGGDPIEIADAEVSDGSYAAVIPAGAPSYFMTSDRMAAVPGETYHLTVMAKRLSGDKSGYIGFWYVDANNNYVGDGAVSVRYSADEWTEYTLDWTVPAGVASFWIEFGVNSNANSSFVIDSIVVTKTGEAPEIPEETEPSDPAGTVVFEDNIEGSDFKQKWALTKTAMPWSDAGYKYEGSRVLLIQGVNDTATSPKFAVVAGKTYTLTYFAKQHTAPAGAADVGTAQIQFLDANGSVLEAAKAPACAVADWTEKTITAVAPAGAVNAQLFFDSGDAKLIYVVDAIVVTESGEGAPDASEPEASEPEASEPTGNLVFSDDFEEHDKYDFTLSNGSIGKNEIPKNWVSYDPANIRVACNKDYFDVYEGYNLFFQEARGDKWIKSPAFNVVAGYTYTVSFMEIKMPGTVGSGAYVKILFLNASGAVVGSKTAATGASATWSADALVAVAPAGAVTAQVEFGLASATGNPEYAVDNLRVYETEGSVPEDTTPTVPVEGGLIINGSFEDGVNNWGSTSAMAPWTEDKVTGNASMIFTDADDGGYYAAQKVSVVGGKTYILSAWVKNIEGKGGYMGLYNLGDANAAVSFSDAKTWTYYTLEVTIPAGYSETQIEIGTSRSAKVTFLIDDIKLVDKDSIDPEETLPTAPTDPTEPADPTEPPVFADSFENYYYPEGMNTTRVPVGWTPSVFSAAIGSATYDSYDGTANLCVQDPKNKDIKSPLVEVVPGYEYTAKYVEKKLQPAVAGTGGYAKIVFVDASGNILKEYSNTAGASAEWTAKVLVSKAPEGATHLYVEFGLLNPEGEPTYSIDNLAVYAKEAALGDPEPTMPTLPMPTEPEGTNEMLTDNFETFVDSSSGNSGPMGWTSSDDSQTVYSVAISCGKYGIENDGNFLCLQNPGDWNVRSSLFAAKAGYAYTASFLARKLENNENYTGYLAIVFIDAYGNVLQADKVAVGKTYGAWAEESVEAVAPVGTTAAYLEFGLNNADRYAKGDYGVDDISVMKSLEPVFIPEDVEPGVPGGDDENKPTGDNAVLLPVVLVMLVCVEVIALVVSKRKHF